MKSQKQLHHYNNVNNSFSTPSQNIIRKESLPKLTVSFQNQQYSLPINSHSTIKKLALELLVMLYDQLLDQQINDDFREVHSTICEILIQQVTSVIQTEKNLNTKEFLSRMIQEYEIERMPTSKQSQPQSNRYFIKNYTSTLRKSSTKKNLNQTKNGPEQTVSTQNFKLYQKGQKSIQRKRKIQKQNAQQKSKVQISYCTFAPNISKSQKKFQRKQAPNVFKRLYQNAQEAKIKNFFKRKQIENEEQKINSSYNFTPEINYCSKLIVNLKEKQQQNDKILFEQLDKSEISFQTSQNSSQKYLKEKSSKKVFEKLYDTSFYENRLNKTLHKVNNENKENSFTYQPELSAGTKRITQNYPKLEKRMEIYNMKKSDNYRSSPNFSKGKDKSLKKIPSEFQFAKPIKMSCPQPKQKKGIRKMLDRIKTEPLQQIDLIPNNQTPGAGKYSSEIFQLESDFVDDESMFEVTPKRLNLDPQKQRAFFKVKQTKKQSNNQETPQPVKNNGISPNMKQLQNKQQIFSKIFVELSMDSNEITARKINSNRSLPSEIRQILRPLTEELSEMDTELDKDEFVWSLQNLYDQLEIQKKAMLLSWGLKLIKNSSPKFNPYEKMRHVKTQGSVFQLVD